MPDVVCPGRLQRASGWAFVASMIVAAVVATPQRTRAAAVPPDQVDASIRRAVVYLYSQQKPSGQWEADLKRQGTAHNWQNNQGGSFGGFTALCTYALLEAGEKPSDPRLVKAINFLKSCDMFGVYSVGLRCVVWSKLAQTPEVKTLLQNDVNRLLRGIIHGGEATGMWDYESNSPDAGKREGGSIDRSISQFGVLGLWAAVQAGATVPPETWRLIDTVWRSGQNADGSWSYNNPAAADGGRATMTAAGTATLLIVQDVLGTLGGAGGTSVPTGADPVIGRGVNHLATTFPEVKEAGAYAWYGVERAGTASGFRYMGKQDWYALGAAALIKSQLPNGSWDVTGSPGTPLTETAMAVLFLAHGRAPVLVNKLNYSAVLEGIARDASWHQRPRDAANLVRYSAAQLEQIFNWQIVSFAASPEEMLEAPVLFLAGGKPVVLTPRERGKLKAFADGGGLILASSESAPRDGIAGHDDFSKSILTLGQQLYPGYTFRLLPLNHPIYTEQQYKPARWKEQPTVWGLSNGVRELIILLPQGDFGRNWNMNTWRSDPTKFEVGADIIQYSISRQPKAAKGYGHVITPTYWSDPTTRPTAANPMGTGAPDPAPATAPSWTPSPTTKPTTRPTTATAPAPAPPRFVPQDARYLTIGRLRLGDNWDPEPGAWPRLEALLANDFHLFVDSRPVEADEKQLAGLKLVHWTGTTAVKLTPPQRTALENYLTKGGTLIVDAAGGSAAFADSAQAELIALLHGTEKELGTLLAADDPIYRVKEGRIAKIEYRRYAMTRLTGKLDAPRLRGVDQAGRTMVFFSREDLTGGCVGQNTDGIVGYTPQVATQIMRNIVLTVAKRK